MEMGFYASVLGLGSACRRQNAELGRPMSMDRPGRAVRQCVQHSAPLQRCSGAATGPVQQSSQMTSGRKQVGRQTRARTARVATRDAEYIVLCTSVPSPARVPVPGWSSSGGL